MATVPTNSGPMPLKSNHFAKLGFTVDTSLAHDVDTEEGGVPITPSPVILAPSSTAAKGPANGLLTGPENDIINGKDIAAGPGVPEGSKSSVLNPATRAWEPKHSTDNRVVDKPNGLTGPKLALQDPFARQIEIILALQAAGAAAQADTSSIPGNTQAPTPYSLPGYGLSAYGVQGIGVPPTPVNGSFDPMPPPTPATAFTANSTMGNHQSPWVPSPMAAVTGGPAGVPITPSFAMQPLLTPFVSHPAETGVSLQAPFTEGPVPPTPTAAGTTGAPISAPIAVGTKGFMVPTVQKTPNRPAEASTLSAGSISTVAATVTGTTPVHSDMHHTQPSHSSGRFSSQPGNEDLLALTPSKAPGLFTVPRNFAPRTAGHPTALQAPPRFDLGEGAMVPYNLAVAPCPQDPFGAGPIIGPAPGGTGVPYRPIPDHVRAMRSAMLNSLTSGPTGLPTLDQVMDPTNFPFIEGATQHRPSNHGVVKLKNIPFPTKRSEVIAFLGRNCKILNDAQEPVHIIMERVTGKTEDAYVEFHTLEDAMKAVEKHKENVARGKLSRLGDRPIDVELSSQAAMMKDLFPVARGIFWDGAQPKILPVKANEEWNRFRGFISEEEMIMLVKHVEVPHRSPFSKECLQRPYECMISTLKKFPWHMTSYITNRQRYAIWHATSQLISLLGYAIRNKRDEINLTPQLMKRLVAAAMSCPGFTVLQKDDIAYQINMPELEQRQYNQPRFADCWRHQYAVVVKPGMPLDVIEWYIAIIREETQRTIQRLPFTQRSEVLAKTTESDGYWGHLWVELGIPRGSLFDEMTLAECAQREFAVLEAVLSRAMGPAGAGQVPGRLMG